MNIHRVLRLLLCLLIGTETQAANILLITTPMYSHCSAFGSLGATLSKRGHRLVAYVADHEIGTACFEDESIEKVTYKISDMEANGIRDMGVRHDFSPTSIIKSIRYVTDGFCRTSLRDTNALQTIKEIKFDVAVVQTMGPARCYLLIPRTCNIPYISLASAHSWFDTGNAFIPGIIPEHLLGYANPMTFRQKILSFGFSLLFPFIFPLVSGERKIVADFAPDMSFIEYMWMIRNSELFIEDNDVLVSGSLPVMNDKLLVGSFSVRSPEPLPEQLRQVYQNAKHGVILVAFGSILKHLPESVTKTFNGAFREIKQSVLTKSDISTNTHNVKTSSWLPQNDILGHNKTVLFISHCGRKSFFESLYHAIPLVCIPFFGDQNAIADRVTLLGIGISIDYKTLSSDKLVDVISLVLREKSFKYNIERMSAFYKRTHPKTAQEMAADAVELVVEHGGTYLRPHTLDWSLVSHLMLDLCVFLLFATILVFGMTFCLCYKVFRRTCHVRKIFRQKHKRQ